MARQLTCGFEMGDYGDINGSVTDGSIIDIAIQSTIVRTGTYAMQISDIASPATATGYDAGIAHTLNGTITDLYVRFAWQWRLTSEAVAGYARTALFTLWDDYANNHVTLAFYSNSATLAVIRDATNATGSGGGTILATGTIALKERTWYVLEAHIQLAADGSGQFVVRINNLTDIAYSGPTTSTVGGASTNARTIFFGTSKQTEGYPNTWLGPNEVYYDDIAVNDTTGSYQNSWPGIGGVYFLPPIAEGGTTGWTPSTGTVHWSLVDEIPANTTDWNQSGTATAAEIFDCRDAPAYVNTINLVEVLYDVALTTSGSAVLQDIIRQGTVDYGGTAQVVTTLINNYVLYKGMANYVQPNGSGAWGTVEVNAAQFGVAVV